MLHAITVHVINLCKINKHFLQINHNFSIGGQSAKEPTYAVVAAYKSLIIAKIQANILQRVFSHDKILFLGTSILKHHIIGPINENLKTKHFLMVLKGLNEASVSFKITNSPQYSTTGSSSIFAACNISFVTANIFTVSKYLNCRNNSPEIQNISVIGLGRRYCMET